MSLARGFVSQVEVIHALILRETRTRFGRNQLGYLWALAEPSLVVLTFYVLYSMAGRKAPHDMEMFGFLVTGVIPFTAFRSAAVRVSESISANRGMLFYPHVTPLDLVIARSILEAATQAGAFMVMMGIGAICRQSLAVHEPLLVVLGLFTASMLGSALGLVFCALVQFSMFVDRAKGPLLRPMFWISGVFFTASMIPAHAREAMLHNPVLHCTEMVRGGWYRSYDTPHFDLSYPWAWILSLLFIGLSLERVVRRRIELT